MSANLFPAKKMTPQQVGLLSAAIPSPFGDALGLLADTAGYVQDPSSLTLGRGLLSLAGLIPGIPSMRAAKGVSEPLVGYHHTFREFDKLKPGGYDPNLSGEAIWFTPSADPRKANIAHQIEDAIQRGKAYDANGIQISEFEVDWVKSEAARLPRNIEKTKDIYRRISEARSGVGNGKIEGLRAIPAKLSIKNPAVFSGPEKVKITTMGKKRLDELKAAGHDGAIAYNDDGSIYEMVVFDAAQVAPLGK